MMEEEEPTRTKVLEVIGTHLITPLFTTTFLYIIKNTSSMSRSRGRSRGLSRGVSWGVTGL